MGGVRLSGIAMQGCSPPFGCFEGTDGDGDANVYRACVDDLAGQATQITDFDDGGVTSEGIHNPVLSPDRRWILFELANPSTGFFEIWVVSSAPGSPGTQLLSDASNYYIHPFWHPDSDTFVCVKGAAGALSGGSILKTSVSDIGTIATLKTAAGGFSPYRPQFNFDGSRVAYNWDQDVGGTGHLRVMDDDGTNDAALDTAVQYRFQGAQFGWANGINVIAYDDGVPGSNAAYVINDDGTGKVQINANGVAAGALTRVSDRAWPPNDSYVIISAATGIFGSYQDAVRAELDGSTTSVILTTNGGWLQDYFRQVLVFAGRIWFIESQTVLGSCLINGTDYRNDLTIDGAAMDDFGTGDGWFYN